MDDISEVLAEWIEQIRYTNDNLRVELATEDLIDHLNQLDRENQKYYIYKLIKKMESETSEHLIRNILKFLSRLGKNIINFNDIMNSTQNKDIIKGVLENSSDLENRKEDFKIMKEKLLSDDIDIQNFVIELIGKKKIKFLMKYLKQFFIECQIILQNELKTLFNAPQKINLNYKDEKIIKINSKLPEVNEYSKFLNNYFENGVINLNQGEYSNRDYLSPINIKINLIRKILNKLNLLITSFIHLDSPNLLQNIRNLIDGIPPKTNIYNYFKNGNAYIEKLKSLCFFYIGRFGNEQDIELLYSHFFKQEEDIKITIIYALGYIKHFDEILLRKLKKIAEEDKYYFYAVSSMMKIGGPEVEDYLIHQLQSKNSSRILMSTFFVPYLNEKRFETITLDLLNYKQPLIIRQALWIAKKKQIFNAIPNLVNLIFSNNHIVKIEASDLLVEFGKKSIEFLHKRINYYGLEKKKILINLIEKINNKLL